MPTKYITQPPPPTIPLTAEAFAEYQAKFKQLTELRVEVMERLKIAREMGDLSENGAYTYAKFELGSIGRQLRSLKHLLTNGYVAQASSVTDIADFGRTVTIKNIETDKSLTFLLIDEHESNPTQQKLSLQSPVGQAIRGKKIGDTVTVITPTKKTRYLIVTIS